MAGWWPAAVAAAALVALANAERKSVCHSDFYFDSKESTYVDKTLFVADVLHDAGRKLVVTAPRGFGKTHNLHTLKAFLQFEVDKHGNRMTAQPPGKPIRDTPNYKLFQQKKIMENREVMDRYFGKSPVVHLDLRMVVRPLYFNETQDFFKTALHEAFIEHHYLEVSDRLHEEERALAKVWCSDDYLEQDMGTLTPGLEVLTKLLFKHFNRTKATVLVDHYDSPIFRCLVDPDAPDDVFKYVLNVVQALFTKKDDFYVGTFFLTGVSQIKELHSSNDNPVQRYDFLNDHRFVPHYGLTEDELFDLLGRYTVSVDNEVFERVQHEYGGYRSMSNLTVANPWATLQYLQRQKLDHAWARACDIPGLPVILKSPDVREKFEMLIKGIPVALDLNRYQTYENLRILRDLLTEPHDKQHLLYTCLIATLLFEHGFLSYDPEIRPAVSETRRYFLPNEEVKEFLWKTLDE